MQPADQRQPRDPVLDAVVAAIPAAAGDDCVLVAIDGPDGAGKTTFANRLAAVLTTARPTVRVSLDDFHHPRAIRHRRGTSSPEGFWLDSYDYSRFTADVLVPLGPGGSRRYRSAAHDLASDADLSPAPAIAPAGAVVIVDGLFLHRPELREHWALSVFLAVPFGETARRMAARDGSSPDPDDPSMSRYVGGQRIYYEECRPQDRAGLVIDNTDVAVPRLIRGQRT